MEYYRGYQIEMIFEGKKYLKRLKEVNADYSSRDGRYDRINGESLEKVYDMIETRTDEVIIMERFKSMLKNPPSNLDVSAVQAAMLKYSSESNVLEAIDLLRRCFLEVKSKSLAGDSRLRRIRKDIMARMLTTKLHDNPTAYAVYFYKMNEDEEAAVRSVLDEIQANPKGHFSRNVGISGNSMLAIRYVCEIGYYSIGIDAHNSQDCPRFLGDDKEKVLELIYHQLHDNERYEIASADSHKTISHSNNKMPAPMFSTTSESHPASTDNHPNNSHKNIEMPTPMFSATSSEAHYISSKAHKMDSTSNDGMPAPMFPTMLSENKNNKSNFIRAAHIQTADKLAKIISDLGDEGYVIVRYDEISPDGKYVSPIKRDDGRIRCKLGEGHYDNIEFDDLMLSIYNDEP